MDVVAIIISKTILFSIPLMLGALAGMFSERSGVINIALEGIMIFGSLFAAIFITKAMVDTPLAENHPQFVVFLTAIIAGLAGLIFSLLLAYAAIRLKANQVITGTALNIFAPSFAILVAYAVITLGVSDIPIPNLIKFSASDFGLDPTQIPNWVNTLLFKNLYLTTFIAFFAVAIAFVVLYKTRFG
ncbi:MAG TPA: ABC transporter permease, partial [Bacillota bacterium]|nr:ABC transporter permease [Bacillota bacterium]